MGKLQSTNGYLETVGNGKTLSFDLQYIDWDHPERNLFHVTKEFAVECADKQQNSRPDIVLFINGIPFAVIECKAPQIPVEQGVEQMITEAEYLKKMRPILADYHARRSSFTYPGAIQTNVHAQADYGDPDFIAETSGQITKIIEEHSQVDWSHNKTIHDRIAQDIDDLFYEHEKKRGVKLSFDTIDKIIENVKTVALRRF